jgi:hypothetical protein
MGITLTRQQLRKMERAFVKGIPRLSPSTDPQLSPAAISLVAGGSTFGMLTSFRLADMSIHTLMLNPVVAKSVAEVILIANQERRWWGDDDGEFLPLIAYSKDQVAQIESVVKKYFPPVPGMAEYDVAPSAVSVFGGSNELGLLLSFRLEDGPEWKALLNPVIARHLGAVIYDAASAGQWWDENGQFILARPDA